MKRNTFLYIFIAVLILLNTYLLVSFNKQKLAIEFLNKNETNINSQNETLKNYLLTSLRFKYFNKGKLITDSLILEDEQKVKQPIRSVIGKGNKLVLRYSELNCTVCVDNEIGNLKKIANEIGRDKIIIMADYKNPRDLFLFKRLNQLDFSVYNCFGKLGGSFDEGNFPFLFVTNETMEIKEVFIPDKTLPEPSEYFYKHVKSKYFSNK